MYQPLTDILRQVRAYPPYFLYDIPGVLAYVVDLLFPAVTNVDPVVLRGL